MKSQKYFAAFFLLIYSSLTALPNEPKEEKPFSPHFKIHGDLLYWVPQASGLDLNFGSSSVTNSSSGTITTISSREKDLDPSFYWNAGYRAGLGWEFNPNGWQVDGLWTDFQSSAHKKSNDGKWTVRLEQIDLFSSYNAHLSSVHLQPFIGLRSSYIHQKLSSNVVTEIDFVDIGTATDRRTFDDQQKFYGLGPLFGLNSNYHFKHGFSLYGNFSFGLLYGNYHLHFDDEETITFPATPETITTKIQKELQAFDFNLDLALGIQWDYLLGDKACLTTKLGLENHQYFNQSRLGYTLGNLSFSGAIYSLAFGF